MCMGRFGGPSLAFLVFPGPCAPALTCPCFIALAQLQGAIAISQLKKRQLEMKGFAHICVQRLILPSVVGFFSGLPCWLFLPMSAESIL